MHIEYKLVDGAAKNTSKYTRRKTQEFNGFQKSKNHTVATIRFYRVRGGDLQLPGPSHSATASCF